MLALDSPIAHPDNCTGSEYRKGQSAASKLKHRFDPQETEEVPPVKKRKRHSSSDSSILAVPIRSQPQVLGKEKGETNAQGKRYNLEGDSRQRQGPDSSGSSTSDPFADESPPPKETFERRARHKTREDKYEPKEGKQTAKRDVSPRKSRKKTEKKSNRKKVAKKSGADLMNDFSSKSIGQERLTVSGFCEELCALALTMSRFDLLKVLVSSTMAVHLLHLGGEAVSLHYSVSLPLLIVCSVRSRFLGNEFPSAFKP